MYCVNCGTEVVQGQVFCTRCGQRIVVAPPGVAGTAAPPPATPGPFSYPAQAGPVIASAQPSRVARHLSALGIFWIILSVLRAIPALFIIALGHMRFPFMFMPIPEHFRTFVMPFMGAIGLLIAGFGIAGIIAGWGLMARCSWARMLAIVLGCISLIHFPFGTALGIYTLWVLVPDGAAVEYQRLAQTA